MPIDLDNLPDRLEFDPVWFEVLAKKYPWFRELLRETPFDQIDKKLGDYESAYRWVVEGRRGYNSGYAYKHWWDYWEARGGVKQWYERFDALDKYERIMDRERKEKEEREKRRDNMVRYIEAKHDDEREAYDRAIKD